MNGPKITVMRRSYTLPSSPIGLSHHGLRLKRALGGPPWWRYINGIWLQTRNHTVWVELFKAYRPGPFYRNMAKR